MNPDSITTLCFSKESRICACSIADIQIQKQRSPATLLLPAAVIVFILLPLLFVNKATDAVNVWFIYVDSFSRLAGLTILPADTSRSRSLMLDLEMAWATKRCLDNGKICTRLSISTTFHPPTPFPLPTFIVLFTFSFWLYAPQTLVVYGQHGHIIKKIGWSVSVSLSLFYLWVSVEGYNGLQRACNYVAYREEGMFYTWNEFI